MDEGWLAAEWVDGEKKEKKGIYGRDSTNLVVNLSDRGSPPRYFTVCGFNLVLRGGVIIVITST